MKNLKKVVLFLGAVSLVAFGTTKFKKVEAPKKQEVKTTTEKKEKERATSSK